MNTTSGKKSKAWVVYILRCSDKGLYTGVTNNIEKRLIAYNREKRQNTRAPGDL